MFFFEILRDPTWQRLTWTLLHFLWQGLAVAAALAAVLWLFHVRRAQVRYILCLWAMLAMTACPLLMFLIWEAPTAKPAQFNLQPEELAATHRQVFQLTPSHTAQSEAVPWNRSLIPLDQRPARRQSAATWKPRMASYLGTVQPYLLAGWIVGVSLLAGRLLLSLVGVQWLRWHRCPVPEELLCRVSVLRTRLGLRSAAGVFTSLKVREAIVVGVLRPMVLLPACWLTEMTPGALEAVIAHELAHIRRWDLWLNVFQRLTETLLFYHPAVWWLSRRIRLEREMCCDELAVAATGQRETYASVLELVARKRLARTATQLGVALGGNRMALLSRVRNVLGISPSRERARWWPAGLLALLVPLVIWYATRGVAQPADPPADSTKPAIEAPMETEEQATGTTPEVSNGTEEASQPDAVRVLTGNSYRVRPFDLLKISVLGTLMDLPIDQTYLVEPSGKVSLGPAYGRVGLQGLTIAETEYALTKHLQQILARPEVQVTVAGRVTRWRSAVLPKTLDRISPYDVLDVKVAAGSSNAPEKPTDGAFLVEGTGHVPLGPSHGRVHVGGLTFDQAEDAIEARLAGGARASVTLARRVVRYTWRDAAVPKPPFRITPSELLDIHATGTLMDQPIRGMYSLEPSGHVALGPTYGRVHIGGLTLEAAEEALVKHLEKILAHPLVSVTLAGWKTDANPESGRHTGRLLVDQVMLIKHWEALENRGEGGVSPVVRNLQEQLKTQDYESHVIRPNDQLGDPFEKQVLKRFLEAKPDKAAGPGKAQYAERVTSDGKRYQYYQPILAQRSCLLVCHRIPESDDVRPSPDNPLGGAQGFVLGGVAARAEGDLLAVVRVAIPLRPERKMFGTGVNSDAGLDGTVVSDSPRKAPAVSVQFVGNTIASDTRLRTIIDLDPDDFHGPFDRKAVDPSVQRLTTYYRGLGFFRATVGREVQQEEASKRRLLTFVIDEGPRYRVRKISFTGNSKLSDEQLTEELTLEAGDYFNQTALQNDVTTIQDRYGSQGYVFADVSADPRFLEDSETLDLSYQIREGRRKE